MALRFDTKEELQAMNKAYKDVLLARASISALDTVIIEGTGLPDLTAEQKKAAPNYGADLKELQNNLITAVANGLVWSNTIEPDVTILPQSYLNIRAYVNAWEPNISKLSHTDKITTLTSQAQRLGSEATKFEAFAAQVCSLSEKVKTDAQNFSDAHAAFAEIEKLDTQNLEATAKAIAELKAMIAKEGEEIEVNLEDAEKLIEVAKGIMEAGEKVKTGTEGDEIAKMLAVTVGVILIGVGEGKIDEALKQIHKRLADATKEVKYQMNLTALTLQLLALQTARSTLGTMSDDIADVQQVFTRAAAWYRARQQDIQVILDAGAPSNEIDEVSLRAYAKSWEQLANAGSAWQVREISAPTTFKVPLAPFDPAIAPPALALAE